MNHQRDWKSWNNFRSNTRGFRGRGGSSGPPFQRGRIFKGGNFNKRWEAKHFHSNQDTSTSENEKFEFELTERELENELSEVDFGISVFISDHEKFSGVIKERYSDFHVNEIDIDGNIVKLTTMEIPKDPVSKIEEDDDDLVSRYCNELLSVETWDEIHALVQKPNSCKDRVEVEVTNKTKEDRTKIHEAVKTVFGQKIVGSTITKDGLKYISFMKYDKNARIDKREKWPKERGGEFVHFLVHKRNCDTMEAAMQLAERLHIKPSMFHYAGTKDRRAKTTQWFSIKRIDPSVLTSRCNSCSNIQIGNFCFKPYPMKLGLLKGNHFRIALRNITGDDETITKAMTSLAEKGFVNYYGLQRFGNSIEVPTHEIGKNLLTGNWKKACELILLPRKGERDKNVATARKIFYETSNAKRALQHLGKSRDRTVEGKLLQGMSKHHVNDYVNALEYVPRNMRLLYIHSYQSLIWNKIVSRRINEFGLKPIAGDLVLAEEQGVGSDDIADHSLTEDKNDSSDNETGKNLDEKIIEERQTRQKVNVLTEDDLDKYTIYDVVLPLPGYDVIYPDNVTREWYKELLENDGLKLEMEKQKVKTYTLSGAYRKCMIKINNLLWSVKRYSDPNKTLIQSDYEEMMDQKPDGEVPDGKYKALVLEFSLPSSCYATMTIREILKCDTSITAQSKLNNYSEQKKADNYSEQKKAESKKTVEDTDKSIEVTEKQKTENEQSDTNDTEKETSEETSDKIESKDNDDVDSEISQKKRKTENSDEDSGEQKKMKIE